LMVFFISMLFFYIFFLQSLKRVFRIIFLIVIILICIAKDYGNYKDLYKNKDIKMIASYLEQYERPNEPILVFRNITAEVLAHYYNGINSLLPLPNRISFSDEYSSKQWTINNDDINRIDDKICNNESFYLIIDNNFLRGVHESNTLLLNHFNDRFNLQMEKEFRGNLDLYRYVNKELQDH
jgi:hypothetical protein